MRIHRMLSIICPVSLAAALAVAPTRANPNENSLIRVGMLATMFKEVKPAMFQAMAKPFYSLVEEQTGLRGELVLVPTPDEMREQMDAGKIQFGVFHGFEFAWMKQKQPALQPLMLAAPQFRPLRAMLVVNTVSDATGFADLKGKTLAMPTNSREYSQLYLNRSCEALGSPAPAFFAKINTPKNAEEALHDVADNETVQAAVVDGLAIQGYAERYPGRAKQIKVVATSEIFPPSVVAYREGSVNVAMIQRFRDGMAKANMAPLGRQLFSLWLLSGFEPIPADFHKSMTDIMRVYPPPNAIAKN
jgi:ABC-type phosphate/phosphonate transport system substrate-binding protein